MFLEPMPPSVLLLWITRWHLGLFLITSLIFIGNIIVDYYHTEKATKMLIFVILMTKYLGLLMFICSLKYLLKGKTP